MIGFGVPAGASKSVTQGRVEAGQAQIPPSVGNCGIKVECLVEVTASARIRPPSSAARDTGIGLKPTLTKPPIMSVISGFEPFSTICSTLTPACCANKIEAR